MDSWQLKQILKLYTYFVVKTTSSVKLFEDFEVSLQKFHNGWNDFIALRPSASNLKSFSITRKNFFSQYVRTILVILVTKNYFLPLTFFARASLGIFFLVAVQASLSNVSTFAVRNFGFSGPKNFLNVSTADFKSSFLFRALLILSVGYLDWSPPQILNFVSLQPSAIGSWNENTIYVLKKEIFQFLGIKSEVYNWKHPFSL